MSKFKSNNRIHKAEHNKDKTGFRIKLTIGCIFVALVFLILIGIIIHLSNKPKTDDYNHVVTPDNIEDLQHNLSPEDYIPTGSYQINMNTSWIFPDGSSPSLNAYVKNNLENQCPVKLTIALPSNNDAILYTSPVIPAGGQVTKIKLDAALPAGVYEAVATYHLLDENEMEVSTVSMNLTISVDK